MTPDSSQKESGLEPASMVSQPQAIASSSMITDERYRKRINRIILLVLVSVVILVLFPMVKMFLTPLLLACTFVSLFYPYYLILLKLFRGNRMVSALVCCFSLVVGFMIPAYFLGYLVLHQVLILYHSTEPVIQSLIKGEYVGVLEQFKDNPLLVRIANFDINWQNTLLGGIKSISSTIAQTINRTSRGALGAIIALFFTLFIMFYLFMDGEKINKKVRKILPLRWAYQEMIITRFLLVSRATVMGTLVIASVQGFLGAIILLIFGVKTWLLWGFVMTAIGLIPLMGAWMVLVPTGILQIISGNLWQGVIILALSFGFVSTIDNVLRPRLVGQSARMHDLLIFFSTIGGLAMFGPVGVLTGPVIMAFFISITEIYAIEFKEYLREELDP